MKANFVFFAGNAGRDAEERSTASGRLVVNLSIATDDVSPDNGEPRTVWVGVQCWGAVADVAKHVRKGDNVIVHGRLSTFKPHNRSYEIVELIASSVSVTRRIGPPPPEPPPPKPKSEARPGGIRLRQYLPYKED